MRFQYLILIWLIATTKCLGQCSSTIAIRSNADVEVLAEFPRQLDTLANKNNVVFVLCEVNESSRWPDAAYLVSRVKNEWYKWKIRDWTTKNFKPELQLLKMKGVSEPLIYLKWTELDMGSGMGTYMESKELWSRNGARNYLDACTRSTHIYKDKYGPDATFKVFNYKYYCLMKITSEGIEVTTNNTCDGRFKGKEGPKQSCYSEVAKYNPGMYIFDNGVWKRR